MDRWGKWNKWAHIYCTAVKATEGERGNICQFVKEKTFVELAVLLILIFSMIYLNSYIRELTHFCYNIIRFYNN